MLLDVEFSAALNIDRLKLEISSPAAPDPVEKQIPPDGPAALGSRYTAVLQADNSWSGWTAEVRINALSGSKTVASGGAAIAFVQGEQRPLRLRLEPLGCSDPANCASLCIRCGACDSSESCTPVLPETLLRVGRGTSTYSPSEQRIGLNTSGEQMVFSSPIPGSSTSIPGQSRTARSAERLGIYLYQRSRDEMRRLVPEEGDHTELTGGFYRLASSSELDVIAFEHISELVVLDRRPAESPRVLPDTDEVGTHHHQLAVSGDGHFLAAPLTRQRIRQIVVLDMNADSETTASLSVAAKPANDHCEHPALSADGQQVAFISAATNLIEDDANEHKDAFIANIGTGALRRISVSPDQLGGDRPSDGLLDISADGTMVAFSSLAQNLVSQDTNQKRDVFVRDISTSTTSRVSLSSAGQQANGHSHSPSLSDDGRYVIFVSEASNLVAGDTNGYVDIFVHDRADQRTVRVSIGLDDVEANGPNRSPAVSGNGRWIAFESLATNLVSPTVENETVVIMVNNPLADAQ